MTGGGLSNSFWFSQGPAPCLAPGMCSVVVVCVFLIARWVMVVYAIQVHRAPFSVSLQVLFILWFKVMSSWLDPSIISVLPCLL